MGAFGIDSTVNNIARTLTDVVTTAGSKNISSATGAFALYDVGDDISGTGIPAGTKIASITDSSHVVLSNACTLSQNPVPTPGVSISTTLQERINIIRAGYSGTCGPGMKFFSSSGWTSSYNTLTGTDYGSATGELAPVMCAKSHDTTQFNTLMTNMATLFPGGYYVCFWQEVNDDIVKGNITPDAYRAAWASMKTARAAHPQGSLCKFIPIMIAYTVEDQASQAVAAGADTQTLLTGVTMDVLGYDIYDNKFYTPTWSVSGHIDPLRTAAANFGVPWAIPEFGAQVSNKAADDDNGRASRVQAVVEYCKADPQFAWMCYWEGGGANGDWTSIGTAVQPVMQAAMAGTGGGGAPPSTLWAGNMSATGGSGTISLTLPAGIPNGSTAYLLAHWAGAQTVTTQFAGWTLVDGPNAEGTVNNAMTALYQKNVGSADSSTTVTQTLSSAVRWAAEVVVGSNVSADTRVFQATGTAATTATVPAYTPTSDNEIVVILAGMTSTTGVGNVTSTPPVGYTEEIEKSTNNGSLDAACYGAQMQLTGQGGVTQPSDTLTSNVSHRTGLYILTFAPTSVGTTYSVTAPLTSISGLGTPTASYTGTASLASSSSLTADSVKSTVAAATLTSSSGFAASATLTIPERSGLASVSNLTVSPSGVTGGSTDPITRFVLVSGSWVPQTRVIF